MRPSEKYLIYGLIDPVSHLVRYVGKSSNGMGRARAHRNGSGKTYKDNWVRGLRSRGMTQEECILEVVSKDSLDDAEIWWIAFGRACGWPLTNLTKGGGGISGYAHTAATRAAMAEARAEFYRSNPHKRVAVGQKTKAWRAANPDAVAALHAAHREKLKEFYRTHPEERERAGRQTRERLKDPVAYAELVARNREQASRPSAKARHSAASSRRWQTPGYRETVLESRRAAQIERSKTPTSKQAELIDLLRATDASQRTVVLIAARLGRHASTVIERVKMLKERGWIDFEVPWS